jgi:16S rRNA (adenine1518-N6/adenine1519-N6)-dimethyltransferase
MAQYSAHISKAFKVSAHCFRPRPEVGSAVVLLRAKEEALLRTEEEPAFAALVKAGFAHRRKTLVNSLRDEGYEHELIVRALHEMEIALTTRAETLALEQFVALTKRLDGGRGRLN